MDGMEVAEEPNIEVIHPDVVEVDPPTPVLAVEDQSSPNAATEAATEPVTANEGAISNCHFC